MGIVILENKFDWTQLRYIEKNVFDNLFDTSIDIKGKTKDNVQTKICLKEYCKWRKLELVKIGNNKLDKTKAKCTFKMD